MADWDILKRAISDVIKTNGNQEITGQLLQQVLLNIVTNVGANATFVGIATPATNPGTPDGPIFYIASESGVYSNFNNIVVSEEVCILKYNNGAWSKLDTGFAKSVDASLPLGYYEKATLTLESGICVFSNTEIAGQTAIPGYYFKEVSVEKGDVITIFGLGAGNGQVFMISKKLQDNQYKALEKEQDYVRRSYSYVAEETGIYAVCTYGQHTAKIYSSTVLELFSNKLVEFNNTLAFVPDIISELRNAWFIGSEQVISGYDASKRSLLNAVKDIWFTNTRNEKIVSDDWFVKLGVFGVNGLTLETTTSVWWGIYLTNGQSATEGVNLFSFGGKSTVSNTGLCEIYAINSNIDLVCHMVLDMTKLDFSTVSSELVQNYHLILNQSNNKVGFLSHKAYQSCYSMLPSITQNTSDIEQLKTATSIISSKPWLIGDISSFNVSTKSIANAIIDVWFSDIKTDKFSQNNWFVKLGIFGINGTSLETTDKIWWGIYLTDGTGTTEGTNLFTFSNQGDTVSKTGITTLSYTKQGVATCNIAIDISKLNFSTLPSSTYSGYYLLLNEGVWKSGFLIEKKTNPNLLLSLLSNVTQNTSDIEQLKAKGDVSKSNDYKLTFYNNVLCAGDSVTAGSVVEGTPERAYISQQMDEYAYPAALAKMCPWFNITKKATPGISATGWLNSYFPTLDFTNYDLVIIELGLNGYLNVNDIDVKGTNTNSYFKIISGIRQQNPTCPIVMSRSSHFTSSWPETLNAICSRVERCYWIDLTDTSILNLDDQKYHGYYDSGGGVMAIDWAHFTRKGYAAKAYVIKSLIGRILPDETVYV